MHVGKRTKLDHQNPLSSVSAVSERYCVTLRSKGTVRVENGGRLEWCAVGQGGGNGSVVLPGVNSTNVFR